MTEPEPLYRRVLGDGFDRLPPPVRRMHNISEPSTAEGRAEITRGRSLVAGIIGWLARLPAAGSDIPTTVLFCPRDGAELWRRTFGGSSFQTLLSASPGRPGHLVERLGVMRFLLRVPVDDEGLSMLIVGMTVLGIPVPRMLWPRIGATERVEDGLFAFDVSVAAPVGGLIVRYRGRLRPPGPVTGSRSA